LSALFVLPWLLQDAFRLFVWLIVTWPILTLYVRIPMPAGVPDLSYDRVLVLLLLGIILIEALLVKRRLMKLTSMDVLVLVYGIAQLSSHLLVLWFGGIGSPDLNGLLDIVLVPLMMYWLAKNVLVSSSHYERFLYALVIASLLICFTGLYEQAMGVRVFKISTRLGGYEEQFYWQDVQGGRAAGALGNPAIYGATLGMGSLAGICCLPHAKRTLTKVALVATILGLLYGVFASYTRSAWIAVFTVLFPAQYLVSGLWRKTQPIFMLGLFLLLQLFMWGKFPINSTLMSRVTNMDTIAPRLAVLRLGWEQFLERPFLGWGSGALNTFGRGQAGTSSHNIFLTLLVDGGLVLFLSFSAVVGYLLIRAICVYRVIEKSSSERNVLIAMTGNILIFLLSGLALELRYFGYFNVLFWISAGVVDYLGKDPALRKIASR
jgi:O-antigen ligase